MLYLMVRISSRITGSRPLVASSKINSLGLWERATAMHNFIFMPLEGKVVFSKRKDELRYHYGIIRCGAAVFNQIDKKERFMGKGNGNAQFHFHAFGQRFNFFIRRKLEAF